MHTRTNKFHLTNTDYLNSADNLRHAKGFFLREQPGGGIPAIMPVRCSAVLPSGRGAQPGPPGGELALVRDTCALHFLAVSSLASSASPPWHASSLPLFLFSSHTTFHVVVHVPSFLPSVPPDPARESFLHLSSSYSIRPAPAPAPSTSSWLISG